MKYIVFAYNIYTLAHAIYYSEKVWGNDCTRIIYSDIATQIPEVIINDYNIKYIPANNVLLKKGIACSLSACKLTNSIWLILKQMIDCSQDEITLVVFRDNEVEEATLIDRCAREYGNRIQYWLISEGNGIYAISKERLRYKTIKKIIYKCFGVSLYSLENLPQGLNRNINRILCQKPDLIKDKVGDQVQLEKVKNVFDNELNDYLVSTFSGIKKQTYRYVYLTQPFDFATDEQLQTLQMIFKAMCAKGNVLVKLHPRDQRDYSQFAMDKLDILSSNAKFLPFECLINYFGYPQIVSMFSSACVGNYYGKPNIYVYKLFGLKEINHIFDDEFYKENHIINCDNLEQLKKVLD